MGRPLIVLLLVVVLAGVVTARLQARRPPRAPVPGAAATHIRSVGRRTAYGRWAGVLGGLAAAWATGHGGALGRGPMLAAPAFALVLLAGVLLGELSVRPPTGGRRSTPLSARRVRDYLPRRMTGAVVLAGVGLLVVLAATTAMGSADDLGRAGRSLARACDATTSGARGPWPGSFYSLPLAAMVLVGLAAAAMVLHRVTSRPRVGGTADLAAADDLLRRRSAESVVAAAGVLVTVPFAGVALVSASALLGGPCPPAWWTALGVVLLVTVLPLLALLGWCLTTLLLPAGPSAAVGMRSP